MTEHPNHPRKDIVTVYFWEHGQRFVIFVSGYALHKENSKLEIVNKIARDIGQEYIEVKTFPKTGLPTLNRVRVY